MAIRTSLGAMRGRLIQQLLIEHLCLGLIGGVIGLFIAWGAVRGILAVWGSQIPRAGEVSLDAGVFLFALAMSVVSGVLAGVLPSLRVTRVSLGGTLSAGGRTAAKGGRNLAGASLVTGEIAVALLLLTGAGLLIRSFRTVLGRDIGFNTNVATAEVALTGPMYATDTARRYAYWDRLIESYRSIPGVEAVGVANWIPLGITGQSFIDIGGRDVSGAGAVYRSVSERFFQALDMPLLTGRLFDRQDGASTQRVAVINRRLAQLYWPGENPIGKQVRARSMEAGPRGVPAPWLTIIGVVGDVRTYGLESDARPELYVLFRQTPSWTTNMTALVRGSVPASRLLREMRARAAALDPQLAVDVGTLDARLRATLAGRVLTMSLLSGFAGLALILAALGIYGVLSYAVTQRTRELAVRAALGAQRGQLLRLVLGAGLRVVVVGMLLGVVASLLLTRMLESMLVEVNAIDPISFVGAVGVLVVVSFVAILVPSLRATRLDPMIALQAE
jgi:putative ABC transport system permease protein